MFKKMRVKFLRHQVKKALKELDKFERELDEFVQKNPDEVDFDDYRALKDLIEKARACGREIVEKSDIDLEEVEKFLNYIGEAGSELGKKYDPELAKKFESLKNARFPVGGTVVRSDEVSEEDLVKLAEKLRNGDE